MGDALWKTTLSGGKKNVKGKAKLLIEKKKNWEWKKKKFDPTRLDRTPKTNKK